VRYLEKPQQVKNQMKKSKENSEHYKWGDNCSGWHLVKTQSLSVIEELMPPKTQEKRHYHNLSQQFFRILSGKATFEIENEIIEIEKGNGIHIPPKTKHSIRNDQSENLEFIVISEPTTRGDRYDDDETNK
jgi:mannose-6-phosphate isomerase-like protein (cupin superfamily)